MTSYRAYLLLTMMQSIKICSSQESSGQVQTVSVHPLYLILTLCFSRN